MSLDTRSAFNGALAPSWSPRTLRLAGAGRRMLRAQPGPRATAASRPVAVLRSSRVGPLPSPTWALPASSPSACCLPLSPRHRLLWEPFFARLLCELFVWVAGACGAGWPFLTCGPHNLEGGGAGAPGLQHPQGGERDQGLSGVCLPWGPSTPSSVWKAPVT